jgi:hypothetical protein
MLMVCPQCKGSFDSVLQCPKCGVRLLLPAEKSPPGSRQAKWHSTPAGRIIAGVVLGLGLSCALLLVVSRAVTAMAPQASAGIFLGLQAAALLAGGILAGAGQEKGIMNGLGAGIVSGLLAFGALLSGALGGVVVAFSKEPIPPLPPMQPMTPLALMAYGLPVAHVLFGALGGLVGMMIWKPSPKLALPSAVASGPKPILGTQISLPPQGDKKAIFPWAGPIAWIRVLIGMLVAVGGAVYAKPVLKFFMELGGLDPAEIIKVQENVAQGELLALSVLIGGTIAGATTGNGLKQGVLVGFGAGIGLVGYFMTTGEGAQADKLLGPLLSSVFLGPLGGWFGSELMPPAPKGRVRTKRKGWF